MDEVCLRRLASQENNERTAQYTILVRYAMLLVPKHFEKNMGATACGWMMPSCRPRLAWLSLTKCE
jgi:hypothetical protein